MTYHTRTPMPGAPDGRPRRPVLLAWSDGCGATRRDLRDLPDTPALEAAVGIAGRGAPLRGPDGSVAVEDIGPGAMVATADGWGRVIWTGARASGVAAGAPLLRVERHAFGAAPCEPVLLGRAALVLLEDPRCLPLVGRRRAFAPLAALAAAHAIAPVRPPGEVETYGLAVMGQAALDVAGLPVASAHPAQSAATALHARAAGDLAEAFPILAEDRWFDPAPVPTLTTAEARALALAGPVALAWIGATGR